MIVSGCELLSFVEIAVLVMLLVFPVASKPWHDNGRKMKTAISPRRPFGDAEKAIMLAYGQTHGLEVDFVFVRGPVQAAELVINGSVEIASAGIMSSYFEGKGRRLF